MSADRILICFDGSDGAAHALRTAAVLLRVDEASILCVGVPAHEQMPINPVGDLVGRLGGLVQDWDECVEKLAASQAQHGAELAAEAGFNASPLSALGSPAEEIVKVAQRENASLIVMGARRHSTVGSLLGSVSSRVLAHSPVPVLIVPARRES